MILSVLPALHVSSASGDTWINNPGAPKTPDEAEAQTKAVYANINGPKTAGGADMPPTTAEGSGSDDLAKYQFNHSAYGHCNILTLRQLCYLDIVQFDKKTAITPSAANGWKGVEPDFTKNHIKGAGGVLGAGLWTGGGNYCNGANVIGDYTTYGITVKNGYVEKGRINIDDIGIKRVTGSGEYGPANYRKKTEPLFDHVNKKLWDYISNLPDPCYNIVLEYGPANSDEVIFGHSMFINAIMSDHTGTKYVYYNESYSSYSNGYRPENLIKEKLADFYDRYKFKPNAAGPTRLWYGGMYFEKQENMIQFKAVDKVTKKQISGGYFVLTADYTYQGQTRRVIMNLRGVNPKYTVFQWVPHEDYDPGQHGRYAKLSSMAKSDDVPMYAVRANSGKPVVIDYSTLKRNTAPGCKDLFYRYGNYRIVLVKPPAGYTVTPANVTLENGVWVVELEKETIEPVEEKDTAGDVFYSEITAYIDHYEIPVSDIGGKIFITVEDLANFGFDVTWDANDRALRVEINKMKKFIPLLSLIEENDPKPAGTVKGKYINSDIKTYLSGQFVQSYSTNNGITLIEFDLLEKYGQIIKNDQAREIYFTMR